MNCGYGKCLQQQSSSLARQGAYGPWLVQAALMQWSLCGQHQCQWQTNSPVVAWLHMHYHVTMC
jgi:hypothetical protein